MKCRAQSNVASTPAIRAFCRYGSGVQMSEGRLRRRAARSLVIQAGVSIVFLVAAVALGEQGEVAGAVVFGLIALVPLGIAIFWGRVVRRGSAAVRETFTRQR